MDFDLSKFLGGAGVGSGLFGLFGNNADPSKAANKYLSKIPGQTQRYFDPYIQAGQRELPGLESQYNELMQHPGQKLNEIGQSFHESPGFQFALQQALNSTGNNAAAGGMSGSPAHMQNNMSTATNLANQDYYNYLNGATGLYGQGLQGGQNMAQMGSQAGSSMADMISHMLAQQAADAYSGAQAKNQNQSGAIGNILGGISSFLF